MRCWVGFLGAGGDGFWVIQETEGKANVAPVSVGNSKCGVDCVKLGIFCWAKLLLCQKGALHKEWLYAQCYQWLKFETINT